MSFFSQLASDVWNDLADIIPSEVRTWGGIVENFIDSAAWQTVRKTADETKNSDTTLAADDELTLAIAASTVYMIRGTVWFESGATPDFKFGFSGPTATQIRIKYRALTTTPGAVGPAWLDAYEASGIAVAGDGTNSGGFVEFEAIVENGGSAGTFAFTWAQNTSNAGNTTVLVGSYLEHRKLTP